MKVLMIGPARSVNGGISAVVNNYYKVGLDKKIELKYIGTMEDGSKFHKLSVAVDSIFKFIWNVCNYDIVHINMASDMSLYRKIPFIYLTKLFHKKLVIHQHGGNFKEFYYQQCGKRKQEFIKKALEKADVFLVVADYLGDIFGQIISKDKIISLPNAIEVSTKVEEKSYGKKLLFLGRLCKEKGIKELLNVVIKLKKEYVDLELYLGGVWVDTDLKKTADEHKDFIYHLGWIGQEEKASYLQKCNIFVLPTYFEGLPMSLLEGMSYECACIASAVGGIPQVIQDGVNGILIAPKDEKSLETAIRKLLEEANLQGKLGKAARQTVIEEFELERSVDKLINTYKILNQTS